MAITFGSTGDVGSGSFSYANDGNFLLVGITSTTNDVSAVSYNSVALASIGTVKSNASARFVSMWGLISASTGTNTLAITGGSSLDGAVISMNGVATTTPYESVSNNTGNSGTGSGSVTTTVSGAYAVGFAFNSNTITASTNTTAVSASSYRMFLRSTNPVAPPASITLNFTMTSNDWNFTAISVNPLVPLSSGAMFMGSNF